jgi:hypothetical protein
VKNRVHNVPFKWVNLYRYTEGSAPVRAKGAKGGKGATAAASRRGEVRINRSGYHVKPFYLSRETVLPIT